MLNKQTIKVEIKMKNQVFKLQEIADINGMTMTGPFEYVGFRFIDAERHVVLKQPDEPEVVNGAIFIVREDEFKTQTGNGRNFRVERFLTTDPANKRGEIGEQIKREGDLVTLRFEDGTTGMYQDEVIHRVITKQEFINYLHHHGIRWFKITETDGTFEAILHPEEKPDLENFSRVFSQNGRPVVMLTRKDFFNELITKRFFGDEN